MSCDTVGRFPLTRMATSTPSRVIVSIPHFGTDELPGEDRVDYTSERFATFPLGYTDAFAAEIYGNLHQYGADVIATPFSRLFVDVNRRRDDYEHVENEVRSQKGVFRTHSVSDERIFANVFGRSDAERWLNRYYDPYHQELRGLLHASIARHGSVFLIDGHTGSPNGMQSHEVILGTSHGRTAHPVLMRQARSVFESAGFAVSLETKGYSGGHIVKRYGQLATEAVHAIQIELNAGLFYADSRRAYIDALVSGEPLPVATEPLTRVQYCLQSIVGRYLALSERELKSG